MTSEEWDRIKELFSAALACPEAERTSYLASACGDRKDLLRTVTELLASHRDAATRSHAEAQNWAPILSVGALVSERYRVIRYIAHGGMGEVFEVYDEALRFRLAMKALRSELISDQASLARFRRELLITRNVSHEGLCRLFDFVEHDTPRGKVPCITMELLNGSSLAELLARERPFPIERVLPLIQQVAAALSALHERGIIHRDLKPSNVMIARRGSREPQAVVTDFGLAKMKNSDQELFESQVRLHAGAPYFMAPELLEGESPSVASDVYSFGLLIDEMVTTGRAYSAESLHALYFAKLWERPVPPAERSSNLPREWNDSILRCLDRDPRQRPAGVLEAVRVLQMPTPRPGWGLNRRSALRLTVGATALMGGGAIASLTALPWRAVLGVFDIENRTGEQFDYLCRGTIAELMRRLSSFDELQVVRLYTSRQEPGAASGYRLALQGNLQAAADGLRLTMQLADHSSGRIVWSEEFRRAVSESSNPKSMDGLLELQSNIASHTVDALESALGLAFRVNSAVRHWRRGTPFAAGSPTSSDVAFDHFLRGQTLLQEGTRQSLNEAFACFEQAIAIDPRFALAHAALAQVNLNLMNHYQRTDELARKARHFAARSLAEDPRLAEAHAIYAAVCQHDWDWDRAEASYNEALRLKPRFPRALRWRAGLRLQFARFDEAIQGAEQARQLDPHDRSAASGHGLTLLFAGRVAEAISLLENAVAGRVMMGARFNLSQAYARQASLLANAESPELYRKAIEQAQLISGNEGASQTIATEMFAIIHSLRGDRNAATPYVQAMEDGVRDGERSPVRLAWIYAIQREIDRAIGLLENAILTRDASLIYVRVNPFLENVRHLPRFHSIVSAMRLN